MRRFDKNKNMNRVNILAEERYLNSKGHITEIFGLSKKEKEIKQLSDAYKLAKDEVEGYNSLRLTSQPASTGPRATQDGLLELVKYKVYTFNNELPNTLKFLGDDIDLSPSPYRINVEYPEDSGQYIDGVTLAGLSFMVGDNGVWRKADAKERLLEKLVEVLSSRLQRLGINDKDKFIKTINKIM